MSEFERLEQLVQQTKLVSSVEQEGQIIIVNHRNGDHIVFDTKYKYYRESSAKQTTVSPAFMNRVLTLMPGYMNIDDFVVSLFGKVAEQYKFDKDPYCIIRAFAYQFDDKSVMSKIEINMLNKYRHRISEFNQLQLTVDLIDSEVRISQDHNLPTMLNDRVQREALSDIFRKLDSMGMRSTHPDIAMYDWMIWEVEFL